MTNSRTRRMRRRNETRMRKRRERENLQKIAVAASISRLPDDILISIISCLTVVEAARTSILSTRWRHLHKYITRLDFFPTSKQLQTIEETYKYGHRVSVVDLYKKYVDVINRTLCTHNVGTILQEFRLYVPLIETDKCLVDSWLQRCLDFAFSKQVQIIHIYVNSPYFLHNIPLLPSKNVSGFKTLKELFVTVDNMDDELFNLLLSNFIALERLSIEDCYKISINDVRIFGDLMAPKLKHLNLPIWVESVEIRDVMNLESLTCRPRNKLLLENVPRLVELDTCTKTGIQTLCMGNDLMISKQLVKLKLLTSSFCDTHHLCLIPKLVNLKHLELGCSLYANNRSNTNHLIHFIEACPCLHKLEIKFERNVWRGSEECCIEEMKEVTSNLHLKRVKLSALFEDPSEMEFGSYIVGKATAIEELVIEVSPHRSYSYRRRRRRIACLRKHFRPMLRDSVNFILI